MDVDIGKMIVRNYIDEWISQNIGDTKINFAVAIYKQDGIRKASLDYRDKNFMEMLTWFRMDKDSTISGTFWLADGTTADFVYTGYGAGVWESKPYEGGYLDLDEFDKRANDRPICSELIKEVESLGYKYNADWEIDDRVIESNILPTVYAVRQLFRKDRDIFMTAPTIDELEEILINYCKEQILTK